MISRISQSLFALLLLVSMLSGCSGGGETRNEEAKPMSKNEVRTIRSAANADGIGFTKEDVASMGLDVGWQYRHSAPVIQTFVENDNIYIVSSTSDYPYVLIKIDGQTGLPRWTYPLKARLEFAPSVYVYPEEIRSQNADELYIVELGSIYCIDDQYGAPNFTIKCDFPISTGVSPGQDSLILGGFDMRAYGVSKEDRFVSWTFLTGGGVTADAVNFANASFVGSEDGNVYKLIQSAGFIRSDCWSYETMGYIEHSPTVFGDRIYVSSRDTKIHCLSDAGEESFLHWSTPTGKPVVSSPVVTAASVYAILRDDRYSAPVTELVSLDTADGSERWRKAGVTDVLHTSSRMISFLDASGKIVSCSASDGEEKWSLDTADCDEVLSLSSAFVLVYDAEGLIQKITVRR